METRIKTALDGFRKSVLNAHGMDFLIVGSLALHELGMETGEPHDIDMEVKGMIKTINRKTTLL